MDDKKYSLLLVDDEIDLLEALALNLEMQGFLVHTAVSGNKAFAKFKETPIDAVITDIKMPDGNGIELLQNIKSHSPLMPVVSFITGFSDLSIREAYHLGVSSVMSKPFNLEALVRKVAWELRPPGDRWSLVSGEGEECDLNGQEACVGNGGICISGQASQSLKVGETYKISGLSTSVGELSGEFILRWMEDSENIYGLETFYLEEEGRMALKKHIFENKPIPYIPKKLRTTQ